MSRVILIEEWPSISEATLALTSFDSSNVAQVCRRSWKRIGGNAARFRAFMRAELKNMGNELLEEGVKKVEGAGGLVAGTHLVEGRAADEILDLAGQIGAGLIGIGSRGGGG